MEEAKRLNRLNSNHPYSPCYLQLWNIFTHDSALLIVSIYLQPDSPQFSASCLHRKRTNSTPPTPPTSFVYNDKQEIHKKENLSGFLSRQHRQVKTMHDRDQRELYLMFLIGNKQKNTHTDLKFSLVGFYIDSHFSFTLIKQEREQNL